MTIAVYHRCKAVTHNMNSLQDKFMLECFTGLDFLIHVNKCELDTCRIYAPFLQATWHPLQDLIVVGRYPDKNFPGYKHNELRTVDIIDPDSGETVYQMYDPGAEGLMSVSS